MLLIPSTATNKLNRRQFRNAHSLKFSFLADCSLVFFLLRTGIHAKSSDPHDPGKHNAGLIPGCIKENLD